MLFFGLSYHTGSEIFWTWGWFTSLLGGEGSGIAEQSKEQERKNERCEGKHDEVWLNERRHLENSTTDENEQRGQVNVFELAPVVHSDSGSDISYEIGSEDSITLLSLV